MFRPGAFLNEKRLSRGQAHLEEMDREGNVGNGSRWRPVDRVVKGLPAVELSSMDRFSFILSGVYRFFSRAE